MAARPRQKLLNHIAVRTRQSHKPTNPQTQLQEIRVRSSMWVCGFLLNDVGFCAYQFLNPHRNSQTYVINPQTHRTHASHATHKPMRFSDTHFKRVIKHQTFQTQFYSNFESVENIVFSFDTNRKNRLRFVYPSCHLFQIT